MGKSTGFLEFSQKRGNNNAPLDRLNDWSEFHNLLPKDEQEVQGARCMDCGVPFCQSGILINGMVSGCPINNLIPEWNDLIYRGKWELALKRLLKTNNFPEFTGRVCPAPCEKACTVSLNGNCVTIKDNERSIIDRAFEEGIIKANPPKVRSDKKVAVIGSGPAGLAAADTLNKRGHNVTVFERNDRIGGLLMYGIPNMKLDKGVIERRVNLMKAEGIEFITNANIGKNYSEEKILKEFDSIVLATGATMPRDLKVTGRDLKGVHFAVDFLSKNTKSLLDSNLEDNNYISAKDKNVIVIGGGDTGTDCVATSLRHGCKSLVQFEIMQKPATTRGDENPWPQWPKILNTDYGQEEFIEKYGEDPRMYCTTVKTLVGDNGILKEAITVDVEWVKNEKGYVIPKEIEGTEKSWKADLILLAMGFVGTEEYNINSFGLERDERNNIKGEYGDFKTNKEKIFVAGDARRGQSLVVWAINEGREVANKVDEYLSLI